jgi:ABC-type uncharacterized transport system substrate-binding protein
VRQVAWIGKRERHDGGSRRERVVKCFGDEILRDVQLLKEIIPGAMRVAFLWNPNNLSHLAYLDEWRAVAPVLGINLVLVEVRSSDQFDSAFSAQ